jgi:hypothetical protein
MYVHPSSIIRLQSLPLMNPHCVIAVLEMGKDGIYMLRPTTFSFVVALVLVCLWSGCTMAELMAGNRTQREGFILTAKSHGMPDLVATFCTDTILPAPADRTEVVNQVVRSS